MSYELNAIISLTIGIGPIIGWVRFHKIDPAFLPFLLLLTIGFLNEVVSIILMKYGYTNIINFNSFKIIESVLLLWQFKNWKLFEKHRNLFYGLMFLFTASWVGENIFISLQGFNSYFIVAQSFILVLLSISMINIIVLADSTPLFRNPVFLICLGLVIYFTYALLVEIFWVFGLNRSRQFRLHIYEIMSYISLLTNLIFAFAFLWIPMKLQYILR